MLVCNVNLPILPVYDYDNNKYCPRFTETKVRFCLREVLRNRQRQPFTNRDSTGALTPYQVDLLGRGAGERSF